jgi:branched-chain amino acid transport system substrate-binding protein
VIKTGNGNLKDPARFGTVYYNLGVVNGILNVEAVRVAQRKYGNKPLTGEQVRWGFEHLNLDDARLRQLGALGLVQPPAVVLGPRRRRRGALPAMERQQVERDQRLGAGRSSAAAPDHREIGARLCEEKNITPRDCSKEP